MSGARLSSPHPPLHLLLGPEGVPTHAGSTLGSRSLAEGWQGSCSFIPGDSGQLGTERGGPSSGAVQRPMVE